MGIEPFSEEIVQWGKTYCLGTPVETHPRYTTLSGKIAFTGILILVLGIVGILIIILDGSSATLSPESPAFLLMAFGQITFDVGILLSTCRHEKTITPLHRRQVVVVYTNGLLYYRKRQENHVVRCEDIQPDQSHHNGKGRAGQHTQLPRKTTWVSSLVLVLLVLLAVGAETFNIIASFHSEPSELAASRYYLPLIVTNPPLSPQAGLPYTSRTVYDAFLAKGMKMKDVLYASGWACCVTQQPEGRLILWEESYGVVLEIATFETPGEAIADAHDLLNDSDGYAVYTRNLCLFFYDSSLSKVDITPYITVISGVCR